MGMMIVIWIVLVSGRMWRCKSGVWDLCLVWSGSRRVSLGGSPECLRCVRETLGVFL